MGRFRVAATLKSADDNVKLDIDKYIVGKTKDNKNLSQMSILELAEPPDPPADFHIIGLVYDLTPDGATFAPEITLTFTYDPDKIPKGVDEQVTFLPAE